MAAKSWAFTLNNWTEEQKSSIDEWDVNRLLVGKEVGESGTPHLQGSVTFATPKRLAAVRKLLPTAHWELMRCTEASFKYCAKSGDYWEVDNRKQGARSDLTEAYALAKGGKTLSEIMTTIEPSYQTAKCMQLFMQVTGVKRPATKREILWFWGPTGTGKSWTAREIDPDLYVKTSYKWWCGYTNEKTVLLDDFRGDFCKFHELLVLLDVYHIRGEIKGGHVDTQHDRVIITSPYHPTEVYRDRTTEDIAQLTRRITEVRHMTKRKRDTDTDTDTEVKMGNTGPS